MGNPALPATILLALASAAAAADAPASGDKPLALRARLETAAAIYRSQVLGPLDHPVGEAIKLGERVLPCRITDKGALEVDVLGDGKFKAFTRPGPLAITLEKAGDKPEQKEKASLSLYLDQDGDKKWIYRVASQLSIGVGSDSLVVVDVNGNGVFNEAGVDGCAWAGHDWLWPLPAAGERFCTPSAEISGLAFGPWGESPTAQGRAIATTLPETLALLKNINDERALIGLTPRPESAKLSADLQKHCAYMSQNNQLTHPEDKAKAGYTPEGHAAGMRSILSMGTPAERIASMMVATFYHRQDVIRPLTESFGLGFEGRYGGIDGRSDMLKSKVQWPVLCPVDAEVEVPTNFQPEAPDPIAGDKQAGFPITAYFDGKNLKLNAWNLCALVQGKPGPRIDCYVFDSTQGGDVSFNKYQRAVGLIAKDPLQPATVYEVSMTVEVDATTWQKTWKFATVGAAKKKGR